MTNSQDHEIVERFLQRADEDSFNHVFRIFSPQLVVFFRRRGHEKGAAEDLAQEVMLTVYRKAGQLHDHRLFRAWRRLLVDRNSNQPKNIDTVRTMSQVGITEDQIALCIGCAPNTLRKHFRKELDTAFILANALTRILAIWSCSVRFKRRAKCF